MIDFTPLFSFRFPSAPSSCISSVMDRDWDEVRASIAELVAFVDETQDRALSKEETARLRAAVKLLAQVKRELKKERPSMESIQEQIFETLAPTGRERGEDER